MRRGAGGAETRIFFLDADAGVQRYEHVAGMALPVAESRDLLEAALRRS